MGRQKPATTEKTGLPLVLMDARPFWPMPCPKCNHSSYNYAIHERCPNCRYEKPYERNQEPEARR